MTLPFLTLYLPSLEAAHMRLSFRSSCLIFLFRRITLTTFFVIGSTSRLSIDFHSHLKNPLEKDLVL